MKKKKEKKNEPCSRTKKTCQTEKRERQQWSIKRRVSHRERAKKKEAKEICFFFI